jgi:transcription elongation GreA/GreB family factor
MSKRLKEILHYAGRRIAEIACGLLPAGVIIFLVLKVIENIGLWTTVICGGFVGLVLVSNPAVRERLRRRAVCPHGIRGGQTQTLCETCTRIAKEIEEAARHDRELQEQRERIEAAADDLQRREQLRLRPLMPRIGDLLSLHPRDFETVVSGMFERLGFRVKQTPFVKDGAVDAFLWKDDKQFLLECKRYSDGVLAGQRDIRMLHSAINENNANGGYFVTTGRFTKDALRFASSVRITPLGQDALLRLIYESTPVATNDDSYRSMCRQCGSTVRHKLRNPRAQQCSNGHRVSPTLDIQSVILAAARPSNGFVQPMTMPRARKAVVGNTYPVRDKLTALGGRWSSTRNAWLLPADKAEEAKGFVANAPRNAPEPEVEPISGLSPLSENADELMCSDTISVANELDAVSDKGGNNQECIRAGGRVSIQYLDDGRTATYTLSSERNDPANGVLSVTSPLGRQVLGLSVGEKAKLELADKVRDVLILDVNNGEDGKLDGKSSAEAPWLASKGEDWILNQLGLHAIVTKDGEAADPQQFSSQSGSLLNSLLALTPDRMEKAERPVRKFPNQDDPQE